MNFNLASSVSYKGSRLINFLHSIST